MKVIFEKAELISALNTAMGAISSRRDNPILECIKMNAEEPDKCIISSYDNEKGFNIEVKAAVLESGCCLLNAQRFFGMVKNLPSDITFETLNGMAASLTSERSRYDIQYFDCKMFPNIPEISARQSFTLKQSELRDVIIQTMFAVADNNDRLQLNGAYFKVDNGYIEVVALDGFRFAKRRIEGDIIKTNIDVAADTEVECIVPKKALVEVIKLLENPDDKITIMKARRHIMFKIKNITFYTSLIDGEYINYERFIPKNDTTEAIVKASDVRDALERAFFVTEYREAGMLKSPVKLAFTDSGLEIYAVSSSYKASDDVMADKTGPDVEIGFNCKMLLDNFRVIDADKVKLSLTTSLSAMSVTPVDDDGSFLYFTYPIRVSDKY